MPTMLICGDLIFNTFVKIRSLEGELSLNKMQLLRNVNVGLKRLKVRYNAFMI